jgi:hypothetical protein
VGTDVVNVDAWGRRLGYCAYDYGSATATPPSGTGLIRGSTASSPTDSWVAVVVISAGPDGVINTSCPAADMVASDVAATGDDMVAARSYGEMVSFGNAQIASTLSGLGTNNQNKLCRLNDSGKMVCDVVIDACTVYQASKWNATSSKFDCINFKPADCAGGRQHSENWSTSCPSGQTGTINYQCLNGVTSQTSAVCYNNCGGQTHGSTWSTSCPSGQTGDISYQCNNGSTTETGSTCATPPPPPGPVCYNINFDGHRIASGGFDASCQLGKINGEAPSNTTDIRCDCTGNKFQTSNNSCGDYNASGVDKGWECWNGTCAGKVCN